MIFGIRIVKLDGESGSIVRNVFRRAAVPFLIGLAANVVPLGCILFAVVDVLFIAGSERRCIHDRIAGTIVVCSGV